MDHDETTELRGMPLSASPQLVPEDSGPDLDISAFDNLVEEIGRDVRLQTFSLFFEETTDRFSGCERCPARPTEMRSARTRTD